MWVPGSGSRASRQSARPSKSSSLLQLLLTEKDCAGRTRFFLRFVLSKNGDLRTEMVSTSPAGIQSASLGSGSADLGGTYYGAIHTFPCRVGTP